MKLRKRNNVVGRYVYLTRLAPQSPFNSNLILTKKRKAIIKNFLNCQPRRQETQIGSDAWAGQLHRFMIQHDPIIQLTDVQRWIKRHPWITEVRDASREPRASQSVNNVQGSSSSQLSGFSNVEEASNNLSTGANATVAPAISHPTNSTSEEFHQENEYNDADVPPPLVSLSDLESGSEGVPTNKKLPESPSQDPEYFRSDSGLQNDTNSNESSQKPSTSSAHLPLATRGLGHNLPGSSSSQLSEFFNPKEESNNLSTGANVTVVPTISHPINSTSEEFHQENKSNDADVPQPFVSLPDLENGSQREKRNEKLPERPSHDPEYFPRDSGLSNHANSNGSSPKPSTSLAHLPVTTRGLGRNLPGSSSSQLSEFFNPEEIFKYFSTRRANNAVAQTISNPIDSTSAEFQMINDDDVERLMAIVALDNSFEASIQFQHPNPDPEYFPDGLAGLSNEPSTSSAHAPLLTGELGHIGSSSSQQAGISDTRAALNNLPSEATVTPAALNPNNSMSGGFLPKNDEDDMDVSQGSTRKDGRCPFCGGPFPFDSSRQGPSGSSLQGQTGIPVNNDPRADARRNSRRRKEERKVTQRLQAACVRIRQLIRLWVDDPVIRHLHAPITVLGRHVERLSRRWFKFIQSNRSINVFGGDLGIKLEEAILEGNSVEFDMM